MLHQPCWRLLQRDPPGPSPPQRAVSHETSLHNSLVQKLNVQAERGARQRSVFTKQQSGKFRPQCNSCLIQTWQSPTLWESWQHSSSDFSLTDLQQSQVAAFPVAQTSVFNVVFTICLASWRQNTSEALAVRPLLPQAQEQFRGAGEKLSLWKLSQLLMELGLLA